MKDGSPWRTEACAEANSIAQLVQVEGLPTHPLLLLKRALPGEAIVGVMTRHRREHGKNVDGEPGLSWDVSLYVPLGVLMLIKNLDSRQMETYLAENVVARLFMGCHRKVHAQIRDHSNMARAYAALGKAGIDEVTHLVIQEAHRFGFVDQGGSRPIPAHRHGPLAIPTNRVFCWGWRNAVAEPWFSCKSGAFRDSKRPWDRSRRSCARSKNTIFLPRAKQKSASF